MKKLVIVIAITLSLTSVTACNTFHGFGKDLQKVGGKMSGEDKK